MCYSPPLLAWFCCRWWCAAPRHSWLGPAGCGGVFRGPGCPLLCVFVVCVGVRGGRAVLCVVCRVTHVPAQPRQRRHTSTSTHGSPGKTRALARCPNPHPRSRYLQDPASYARPRSPGPSSVSHSPLLRLRLHNLHHHDHLNHHHHHVLIQHYTPLAAGDTSQTGPQTRPHRERLRRRQGPRPDEASTRDPAETQDRCQTATQTHQRATTATRSQAQTQAQTGRQDGSASRTPRGRPL